MNKEELKKYLKENICFYINYNKEYQSIGFRLYLEDEEISNETIYLEVNNNE